MIRGFATVALVVCALVAIPAEQAVAECVHAGSVTATTAGSYLNVSASSSADGCTESPSAPSAAVAAGTWHVAPVCAVGGTATCAEFAQCADGSLLMNHWFQAASGESSAMTSVCPEEQTAAPPEITNAMVLRALRRVDLPASTLQVQPPNGRTLVNFATNFYTEAGEMTRSVTLLDRSVELRIWPVRYGWSFGDGVTSATSGPGAPYPDLEVTHDYGRAGPVSPRVNTIYAAEFRVDGGPWREVAGTVTVPGEPVDLQVLTATPTLVGYR